MFILQYYILVDNKKINNNNAIFYILPTSAKLFLKKLSITLFKKVYCGKKNDKKLRYV